jgi:uncharacterized protein YjbI with pentapeptide repeats
MRMPLGRQGEAGSCQRGKAVALLWPAAPGAPGSVAAALDADRSLGLRVRDGVSPSPALRKRHNQRTSRCDHLGMKWAPDGPNPCDGTLGRDAADLLSERGTLAGIRADYATAFVPLPGRDYRSADLSTADLSRVRLQGYDLRCANLRMATLRGASFLWSDLRWADLRGATLRQASLAASDLRHADLGDTDLRGAEFGHAQDAAGWRGCNLGGARLDGCDLRGARFSNETIWPEDFDPIGSGAELMP